MSFKDYIEDFRKLNVKLSKSKTGNEELVRKIQEDFKLKTGVLRDIDALNRVLGRHYSGKMKFDFVLDENKEEEIKLKKKARQKIKLKQFELNDQLSKLKTIIESELRDKYK